MKKKAFFISMLFLMGFDSNFLFSQFNEKIKNINIKAESKNDFNSQLKNELAKLKKGEPLGLSVFSKTLTELPSEEMEKIGNNLQRLGIICEKMKEVPIFIKNFTGLRVLSISSKNLKSKFPDLSGLTNLEYLGIDGLNDLTSLLSAIKDSKKLNDVTFSGKNLSNISPKIGQLVNVKRLEISGTFKTVPLEMGNLTNLERLSLSSKNLSTFPKFIEKLEKLAHLHISGQSVKTLPPGISELPKIENIWVDREHFYPNY